MFVAILRNDPTKETGSKWSELAIADKPVGFLRKPLLSQFSGSMLILDGRPRYWRLSFFKGTAHTVDLFVAFHEEEPETKKDDLLARGIWQAIKGSGPDDQEVRTASQWLRRSNSLTLDCYDQRADRWVCADGAGLSMFTPTLQKPTFERAVVLLALCCAYQLRIEALVNELAEWDNKLKSLDGLARTASEFNARCYFQHPVKLESTELPIIWDQIAERMRLDVLDEELMGQVNTLHALASDLLRSKEQRRWNFIGSVLAVISALQVFSLIPESVRDPWIYRMLSQLGWGG